MNHFRKVTCTTCPIASTANTSRGKSWWKSPLTTSKTDYDNGLTGTGPQFRQRLSETDQRQEEEEARKQKKVSQCQLTVLPPPPARCRREDGSSQPSSFLTHVFPFEKTRDGNGQATTTSHS
ncbi:hypothetical protein NPIL_432241 [Nephila pilipes]|uniref:Uncharacterized protein n=1 Tax=Nephila pilipes TaxID=299642 RepID=A0A8X6QRG4_NEPPI|nr:hypothetical protein NPIL_432241 [Nephila pilipes]